MANPNNYQVGGWYQGRQWSGTSLGAPGVINVPGMTGYGQPVSNEVIAQTAPENVAYIQQQRAQYQPQQAAAPSMPSMPSMPDYQSLYESSGLADLERQFKEKQEQYIKAQGSVNDNPFLSEASRVGRIAKLEDLFAQRTSALQREIESKRADLQWQMNYQLQAQQAMQPQTQVVTGGGRSLLINTQTGETIKDLGSAYKGTTASTTPSSVDLTQAAAQAAQAGKTYPDMLAFFIKYGLSPQDIYQIYTATNYYGRPPDDVDPGTGLPNINK